jgi:hypothetical protein
MAEVVGLHRSPPATATNLAIPNGASGFSLSPKQLRRDWIALFAFMVWICRFIGFSFYGPIRSRLPSASMLMSFAGSGPVNWYQ